MYVNNEGFHISIEGIDNTGKSTICNKLKTVLSAEGMKVCVVTDPPSISPWVDLSLLFKKEEKITKFSEAMLLLSSRLDTYEKYIKPFLKEGGIVISDRYVDSWFAYQSNRLQLYFGSVDKALSFLLDLNECLCKHNILHMPNMTILLNADPSITMKRLNSQKRITKYNDAETQYNVRKIYLKLVKLYDLRYHLINTNNKDIDEVFNEVLCIIKNVFKVK